MNGLSDPTDAILNFIAAAHPSDDVAQNIVEHSDTIKIGITKTMLSNQDQPRANQLIHNVPHTLSPVKAQLAYVQSPCGEHGCHGGASSRLNLVWRLEVEMEENWYEAYVDARSPSRIVSVVDWISDYSAHSEETNQENECWPGYSSSRRNEDGIPDVVYKVWPWGINDPSVGKRDIVKNPYDKAASPLGWHAVPPANNPQRAKPRLAEGNDDMCYFPTTWGNNVSMSALVISRNLR